MKKKIGCIILVQMVLILSIAGVITSGIEITDIEPGQIINKEHNEIKPLDTQLQKITLEDDAFHYTKKIYHCETWYFDAVFTNNYSMSVIVSIAQKGNQGMALTGLYIYKDAELIHRPRTLHMLNKFFASDERLDMKISDETRMYCDINDDSGSWTYQVIENFGDISVDLLFTNMTPGWKTDITGGWWLVSPRLEVNGWMMINGENISVSGEGYHDHNWFYANTPFIQEGWHFGNIAGDNLGITWATVMSNCYTNESITVLNQKQEQPSMINPQDVNLTIKQYTWSNGKKIPQESILEINNDRLQVNLTIKTLNYNFVKLPMLSYWRFHLSINGTITYDSITENITNIGFSELMKFSRFDDIFSDKNNNLERSGSIFSSKPWFNLLRLKMIENINNPNLKKLIQFLGI